MYQIHYLEVGVELVSGGMLVTYFKLSSQNPLCGDEIQSKMQPSELKAEDLCSWS